MKKITLKTVKGFFSLKKTLRIVYLLIGIIALYYALITGIFLLFLLPLVFMWLVGVENVEFFNTSNLPDIQRTDISYFTSTSIVDSIKLLITVTVLILIVIILRKIEQKLK